MPRRCSVYGCRTNYDNQSEYLTTFFLPKDEGLRQKWLKAIPTDVSKVKNPIVCIKHFHEDDIVRVDKVVYKGDLKEYPRARPKLKENAIPKLFTNVPHYLSNLKTRTRRLPDVEEAQIKTAIRNSISDHVVYQQKNKIATLKDVANALMRLESFQKKWTFVQSEKKLVICFIDVDSDEPCAVNFITVFENLSFNIYVDNVKLQKCNIPFKYQYLNSFGMLEDVLLSLLIPLM